MPHVPTVDIRRLGDIRFDTQLERALRPSPDYDVSQWLFVPNQYTEYRYIPGAEASDLHRHQPLHRPARGSGPHPEKRGAGGQGQRL